MIRRFFGAEEEISAPEGVWPQGKIVSVLRLQYEKVEHLGEEEGFVLYGINDRGLTFVVALVTAGRENVVEVGFLARFVGFDADQRTVEHINRNLHISVAGIEDEGDLYLLAGVSAAGAYDDGTFSLILEAWRRDLMMVLHALGGGQSVAAAFPAARFEAARSFATNRAPSGDAPADLLKAYLGDRPQQRLCEDCGGRGKRGLIAKTCDVCAGSGFVIERRR